MKLNTDRLASFICSNNVEYNEWSKWACETGYQFLENLTKNYRGKIPNSIWVESYQRLDNKCL